MIDPEKVRAFFMEHGWSIHMDDREGQPLDPFLELVEVFDPRPELDLSAFYRGDYDDLTPDELRARFRRPSDR